MSKPLDGLREEISKRLDPQEMRLLCGEMSSNEMLTAKALLSWTLRMVDRHEQNILAGPQPVSAGLDPDTARLMARSALQKTLRSCPDSVSSQALHRAMDEVDNAFSQAKAEQSNT